jgi:DNA-binding GntR family transcriptional regulator
LNNQYLDGILDAFWEVYHLSGLEVYPDFTYVERVWQYHARIVEQLRNRNYSAGLSLLIEHMDLVNQREKPVQRLSFE